MDLKSDDYSIWYNPATQTVTCRGTLRLSELEEYTLLVELLNDVIAQKPCRLTLDLRDLRFLNSSGFNVLSKFVLQVRQVETIEFVIQSAQNIPWHQRSLKNLQRLMPSLQLLCD
ncbi:MAG: hypothetical protein HEQ19_12765 [Gloeotrichia echinulata CP02]|jgi:hypothetical protein